MSRKDKIRRTRRIPISDEMLDEIDRIIETHEGEDYVSPSEAIREAIRDWLDKKKRQEVYLRSESRNNL